MFELIAFGIVLFVIHIFISSMQYEGTSKKQEGDTETADTAEQYEGADTVVVTLEEQMQRLSEDGITLNSDITMDDIYDIDGREAFEFSAYDFLFYAYGIEAHAEPRGRYMSDSVWKFDFECIYGDDSYAHIVKQLARLSGAKDNISELTSSLNLERSTASLSYKFDGIKREYKAKLNDGWVDHDVLDAVLQDFETNTKRFYSKENFDGAILFYLDKITAKKLNEYASTPIIERYMV